MITGNEYKSCTAACKGLEVSCPNQKCRMWIDYEEDLNCTNIAVERHGDMTLREIAKREGVSFVRIKQIEDAAKVKLRKRLADYE
jgi:hypothetical protein